MWAARDQAGSGWVLEGGDGVFLDVSGWSSGVAGAQAVLVVDAEERDIGLNYFEDRKGRS